MFAISLFWDTNMAAVMSDENHLYNSVEQNVLFVLFRYQFGDTTIKKLADFGRNILLLGRQGTVFQFFPFLKYLSPEFTRTFKDVITTRDEFFGLHLDHHRETYKKGVIRDITDALLNAYENEKDKHRDKDIGDSDDVKFLMLNVILAGTDTSTTVLTWFMLYMILYEDVQEKVYREINQMYKQGISPCWRNADSFPYLQATICEVIIISICL